MEFLAWIQVINISEHLQVINKCQSIVLYLKQLNYIHGECIGSYLTLHDFNATISMWYHLLSCKGDSSASNVLVFVGILAQIYSLSNCEIIEMSSQVWTMVCDVKVGTIRYCVNETRVVWLVFHDVECHAYDKKLKTWEVIGIKLPLRNWKSCILILVICPE